MQLYIPGTFHRGKISQAGDEPHNQSDKVIFDLTDNLSVCKSRVIYKYVSSRKTCFFKYIYIIHIVWSRRKTANWPCENQIVHHPEL